MNAPEPRANPLLLGHEAAEAEFARLIRTRRLHHGWLILGPPGIGKATLAFRLARRLLAGPPFTDNLVLDPAHPVFRRVAAGAHADLLTIAREWHPRTKRLRSEIVVETVLGVSRFLHLTPAEGGWRVVVIDEAETLNRNAANALLKLLEEPPPRSLLLLVCNAPGRLPATIRSRCRRLVLAPFEDQAMRELLGLYLPETSEEERERLLGLAEGAPGRALALAETGGVAIAAFVEEALAALPASLPPVRRFAIAAGAGASEESFALFMDFLRASLATALRDATRGRADPDQARILGTRPLAALSELWQALTAMQDETERFALDRRSAILLGLDWVASR